MASTSIPRSVLSDKAGLRLLCLPYAGGGAAVYHRWRAAMPEWIDLVPLTLPGHDGRLRERPCTDLRQLAAALADEIRTVIDRPYAVVGCSMGAWLAFELTLQLRRSNDRLPELLVVAASPPPHARSSQSPTYLLPDDAFVATVERRYAGIPAAVRASPELLELLLPALRADLQMVETYEYVESTPLETPILALAGTEDPTVSAAQLAEWRRHTTGDFSLRLLAGGHFFLFQAASAASPQQAGNPSRGIPPALGIILSRLERTMPREAADTKSPD